MRLTFALSLLFISINCFAQKQIITLNLKKDSTYYMSSSATLTITEEIPGQTQVISTVISGKMAHKVIAIRDSIYEMEVTYKSLSMHMDLPGGKSLNMNTDVDDGNNLFTKVMRSILEKPFIVVINKKAQVLEVRNTEALYSDITKNIPQATEVQKAQFKSQMEQSFGEKAFRGTFQDAFAVFPVAAVGLNDRWAANTSIESMISIGIKTTYTLQEITDKAYQIHGDAVVSSPANPEFKQLNGMPIRYVNLSGTTTSDIKLDKTTGWVNQSKVTKLIKGTVEIKDNPTIPGGTTFPITIAGDIATIGQ